ncbi:MAG: DUF4905 domain-containing protein [Cyclobacteriaceae bacterium]
MYNSRTPFFSRSFDEIIWQIKIDPDNSLLAIELRKEGSLEFGYMIISIRTSESWFIPKPEAVNWWSSLSAINEDKLLINQFEEKGDPGSGRQIVLNWRTQEVFMNETWKNVNLSGNVLIPNVFEENSSDNDSVLEYLALEGIHAVGSVEYMEQSNHIIIGFYLKNEKSWTHELLWLKDESVFSKEVLDEESNGLGGEGFFTFEKYLIFVQNRQRLVIHEME